MKKTAFIIVLSILITRAEAQDTWNEVAKFNGIDFEDVYFVNSDSGWAWGRKKFVRTVDGGNSWSYLNSLNIESNYTSSFFWLNGKNGWFVNTDHQYVKATQDGGVTWSVIQGPGAYQYIDVFFVDTKIGWLTGTRVLPDPLWQTEGVIWKTIDGGLTWIEQSLPIPSSSISQITFINSETGFATVDSGPLRTAGILSTKNGGVTWETAWTGDPMNFFSLFVLDPMHVWAGNHDGKIISTNDGGISWSENEIEKSYNVIRDIEFIDELQGLAVSDHSLFRTLDGGSTWKPLIQQVENYCCAFGLGGVHMKSPSEWYLAGRGSLFIHTLDSGTWTRESTGLIGGIWGGLSDVVFGNSDNGWAIGAAGAILHSADKGVSWILQNSGRFDDLLEIDMCNDSTAWVVGLDGTISSTANGGKNWTQLKSPGIVQHIELLTNETGLASSGSNLYKTSNGGESWTNVQSTQLPFTDIFFVDSLFGWASALQHPLLVTSDGGKSWSELIFFNGSGRYYEFEKMFVVDKNIGWAITDSEPSYIGSRRIVVRTIDAGRTWSRVYTYIETSFYPVSTMFFSDKNNGWIADGPKGKRTYDGGLNWIDMGPDNVTCVYFNKNNMGWGCTNSGGDSYIYRAEAAEAITTDITGGLFYALEYHPNPTNDLLKIGAPLDSCRYTFSVFNMEGREFLSGNSTTIDGYETVNLHSLSAGQYVIKLEGCQRAFSFRVIKE